MSGRLPSPGFLGIVLVYAGTLLFFAWGLRTPPLDRVWSLAQELESGQRAGLNERDRCLLREALFEHTALASALLGARSPIGLLSAQRQGWLLVPGAVGVRTEAARASALVLEILTPLDLLPLSIEVRGDGWEARRVIDALERARLNLLPSTLPVVEIPLGEPRRFPELFEIKLRGAEDLLDSSMIGVRVGFARHRAEPSR